MSEALPVNTMPSDARARSCHPQTLCGWILDLVYEASTGLRRHSGL